MTSPEALVSFKCQMNPIHISSSQLSIYLIIYTFQADNNAMHSLLDTKPNTHEISGTTCCTENAWQQIMKLSEITANLDEYYVVKFQQKCATSNVIDMTVLN